jgi:broad specificity phosphatase PhoE
MAQIFVRHGRSLPDAEVPPQAWPLDPEGRADVAALAQRLPALPVVCSDVRRAIETAALLGVPIVDARLAEVSRPFVSDLRDVIARYLSGLPVEGWEPQADAIARIESSVAEHGDAIYVTHGTVLALFMASRCTGLDAHSFWARLRSPDAWLVRGSEAVRVG